MAEEKGNPDATQDKKLIWECINEWASQELVPVFQKIVSELNDTKTSHGEHRKITDGILSGFGEAVKGHRKKSLGDRVNFDDLGDITGTYNDLEGSDLKEDLINYIMENDISDEELDDLLNTVKENAKSKYGKYKKVDGEPVKVESKSVEVAGEPAATETAVDGEPVEEESSDPATNMIKKMMAVAPKKNKL